MDINIESARRTNAAQPVLNEARSFENKSPKTTSDIKPISKEDTAEIRSSKLPDDKNVGAKIREEKIAEFTKSDLTKKIDAKKPQALYSHERISRDKMRSFT